MITARLCLDPIDPAALLRDFLGSVDGEQGAVVSFVGLTRATGVAGEPVSELFLDHHSRLSEASLTDIAAAAAERFELGAIHIAHRAGTVVAGDPIVWVAAAARHRRAAFDAADFAMDRLKTEAMLWKREDGAEGSRWIEPSAADHQAVARWNEGSS